MPTKVAVSVISYDRPKTLYVCLYSILQMNQVEKVHVFVFLIENDTLMDRLSMIGDLPVNKMVIRERGGDSFMEALRHLFYTVDCSHVISVGDDQLLCTDTLDYVLSLQDEDKAFIDALGGSDSALGNTIPGIDTAGGLYIKRQSFELLDSWLDTEECIQRMGPSFAPKPLPYYRYYDFDRFLAMYMNPQGLRTRYAPAKYGMCFGLCGIHSPKTPNCYETESDRFFAGDKHTWLSNITSILASDEELPVEVTRTLLPRHFVYR